MMPQQSFALKTCLLQRAVRGKVRGERPGKKPVDPARLSPRAQLRLARPGGEGAFCHDLHPTPCALRSKTAAPETGRRSRGVSPLQKGHAAYRGVQSRSDLSESLAAMRHFTIIPVQPHAQSHRSCGFGGALPGLLVTAVKLTKKRTSTLALPRSGHRTFARTHVSRRLDGPFIFRFPQVPLLSVSEDRKAFS